MNAPEQQFAFRKKSLMSILGLIGLGCLNLVYNQKVIHPFTQQQQKGQQPPLHESRVCNITAVGELIPTNFTSVAVNNISKLVTFQNQANGSSPPVLISHSSNATCEIYFYFGAAGHFPHFMQQFYRCWSFWNAYPLLKKQMVIQNHNGLRTTIQHQGYTRALMRLLPQLGIDLVEEIGPNHSKHNIHVRGSDYRKVPFQVASTEDMSSLRRKMQSVLNLTNHVSESCTGGMPRIGMVNRKSSRRILNGNEILQDLKRYYHLKEPLPEIFFEGTLLVDQVKLLSNIDILITPHGAQETNIAWMPKCGQVLEMMPENYWVDNYFGSLAAITGLTHLVYYVAKNTSHRVIGGTTGERIIARSIKFCLSKQMMREGVDRLVQQWRMCCHKKRTFDWFGRSDWK